MSSTAEIVFEERISNGIEMENIINVADCCRACLRIDCSLTPTTVEDNDSIKFQDKLLSCVSEVVIAPLFLYYAPNIFYQINTRLN